MYGLEWGVMDRHPVRVIVELCVPVLDRVGWRCWYGVAVGDHLRIVHRDRRVSGRGGPRAAPLAPAVAVASEGGGVPSEVGCVWRV